jgi:hypothetical protein
LDKGRLATDARAARVRIASLARAHSVRFLKERFRPAVAGDPNRRHDEKSVAGIGLRARRNPLGGRNPCFYYDSAMVDYSTALFDLAMVALPIEDAKKLITAATQGDVYVSQLLSALCVPASEFETLKKSQQVGPVTQAQIAIYRKTNNLSAPDSAKLNRAEATAVRQLGPCGTGLGKNPFEKKTYVQVTPGQAEAAMAELIGFLKKISPTAQLDPKTTKLDNVRTLITEARRHPRIAPKLKNLPPAFNDQITPDLYEALFDL